MYSDPEYGTFYLTEVISQTNSDELKALAANCDQDAECSGKFSIVTVRDGLDALLIAGSEATSIVVLSGDVRIDIVGPAATFSPDEAVTLANAL